MTNWSGRERGATNTQSSRLGPLFFTLSLLFVALSLLGTAAWAQSTCATGQICSVTSGNVVYTVLGPCDLSNILGSSCYVLSTAPVATFNPCPGYCGAAAQVVQDPSAPTQELEAEAKAQVASLRGIPNDTLNDFWSRGEVLADMYLRLLGMANSSTALSAQDQAVVNYYTKAINTERVSIATEALDLYSQWQGNPCGFHVPVGDPNSYINEQFGSLLSPGPCALAVFDPTSPACALGECIPPPPSAAQFTEWAAGVILKGQIQGWGQLLYSESGITFPATIKPAYTPLQVAQGIANTEYDESFGDTAEGVEYITAKHASLANIASSTETTVEQDLQGAWIDGLHDVAGEQYREAVINVITGVFKAGVSTGQVDTLAELLGVVGKPDLKLGNTLEELGLATQDTEFSNTVLPAAAQGLEEDLVAEAGDVAAETWDTIVGPAVAGAVIVSFEIWQQVQNASVATDLQTALCNASGGQQYSSACSVTSQKTLNGYAQDATGRMEILTALIKSAVPSFSTVRLSSAYGVAPSAGPTMPTDPGFIQNGVKSGSFTSLGWDGSLDTTSVAGSWFVQSAATNVGPSQLAYLPSVAYLTPSTRCTTTGAGISCTPLNVEGWRAWLDNGNKLLAQREFVVAGTGAVQDATNTCPTTTLPTGNVNLGNVCVTSSQNNFPFPIQAGDEISIGEQVRKVSSVVKNSAGDVTAFMTTAPFENETTGSLPSGDVLDLANPDGNCLSSSAFGSRVQGNDCTEGTTINPATSNPAGNVVTITGLPAPAISFDLAGLSAKKYGDAPFSLSSYLSSNSAGAYSATTAANSNACTVDASGTVTITAAGTCALKVSQTAAGGFGPSLANPVTFPIAPAALTVTAAATSKVYGVNADTTGYIEQGGVIIPSGTATTGIGAVGTGLVNGDQLHVTQAYSSGGAASASVGSYSISISQATVCAPATLCDPQVDPGDIRTSDYTITYVGGAKYSVTPAGLSITANNQTKTYGQAFTEPANGYTVTGLVNTDTVTSVALAATGTQNTATVAGSPYSIIPSAAAGAGLSNYTISYHNGTLTVQPAPLTITAHNFTKTYGQVLSLPASDFTAQGLLFSSDTVTGVTLASPGTAATATVPGSPYAVTGSNATGTGLGNYSITYDNGSLTVTPAPLTVTAANQSKTYGQTFTFTGSEYSAAPLLNGDSLGTVTLTSLGAPATAPVNGSPYAIAITPGSATGAAAANYAASYVNGAMTVKPAPLTITASNATIIIGAPAPTITPSYSGFVNGQGPGNLSPQATCTTTVSTASPVGTYANSNTCSGAVDTNYAFTYVAGNTKVTYGVPYLTPNAVKNDGSTVPILVELQNFSGANLSSANVTLTVAGLSPSPAPGVAPAGSFAFTGSGYELSVHSKDYPTGTYTLSFSVSGDPNLHTVSFVLY